MQRDRKTHILVWRTTKWHSEMVRHKTSLCFQWSCFCISAAVLTESQQGHRLHSIHWTAPCKRIRRKKIRSISTRYMTVPMLKERDCVLPIYSSVTPYASKYAKTSIMTPHDKACLLSRTVTCWCWAKYQMVRWVKCTLLHWWSKQQQSYCIGGPNTTKPLASLSDPPLISEQSKLCIHRQRFQGHIGGGSVMCLW